MSKRARLFRDIKSMREAVRPFELHYFMRLRSTNDRTAEMRKRGNLFAPAAVLTFDQTAGRGRGDHVWWSGAGCLTVTFVLPIDEYLAPTQVPLAAGLAVRNAAAEVAEGAKIRLKWPNDIMHAGRKLGGVLCERIHKVDLIGVGLNVNLNVQRDAPEYLRPSITSLSQITGREIDLNVMLSALARNLLEVFSRRRARPFPALLREYEAHHELVGRKVAIRVSPAQLPLTGICEGLDDKGRLLLRAGKDRHRLTTGQIEAVK